MPPMQKGLCYVTWESERYSSPFSDKSLEKLSNTGANCVSIVVTQYQDNFNSTVIKKTELTPTDNSLKHVIKRSHTLGLEVMLKPHVDIINRTNEGHWRADIGFANDSDWVKWFKGYKDFILHYARMAEKMKVEIFCIGTELSFTTEKDEMWRKEIIREVRKVYKGKLVYAANWDNYNNIKFWDELDYVGIDAYFPLTYGRNPSYTELRRGWTKWKSQIRSFHSIVNKPIIFTEIGYPSSSHAPMTPWKSAVKRKPGA